MPPQRPLLFDPIDEARRQWKAHGWSTAADGMGVVTSVIRVEQLLSGRAEAILRPLGLTFARYEVLMLLHFSKHGVLPLGKIGERLQVGAASVTNAIDRLESNGLVLRRVNPNDGRGVLAAITTKGSDLATRATDVLNSALFTSLELSQKEAGVLFGILATLRRRAGDFE